MADIFKPFAYQSLDRVGKLDNSKTIDPALMIKQFFYVSSVYVSDYKDWRATMLNSAIEFVKNSSNFDIAYKVVGSDPDGSLSVATGKNLNTNVIMSELQLLLLVKTGGVAYAYDSAMLYEKNAKVISGDVYYTSQQDNNKGQSISNSAYWKASTATTTSTGAAYLPQQIVLSNDATTPNTVMDWAAGVFQFSDGTGQAVLSAITKSLASNWAVGTGNGGLDTGTKANSTWYHCYAIYNPTTGVSDALFSVGATTPTSLPSGYAKYKRIGSIVTDSSGNIRPGKFLFGNGFYYFTYNSPSLDVNATAQGTSAVLYTIPAPLGLKTTAFMNISTARGGTPTSMYFSDPDSTDLAPSVTVAPLGQLYMGSQDIDRMQTLEISTNTSSQIRTRWSNSDGSTTMKIAITKFLDITN